MIRRMLITLVIFAVPALVALLFSYDIVAVDFDSFMENQPSVGYEEGPRLLPPEDAVPVSRPFYAAQGPDAENPVPADEVSLQRGEILFELNCVVCHGGEGRGDGPVTRFWREDSRPPADLVSETVISYSDGVINMFITQGIGTMPPLRENLDERQRWDVINYLRYLQVRTEE